MDAVRALVVDDHELYRRGLVGLLQPDLSIARVGEGCHGGEAIQLAIELSLRRVTRERQNPRRGCRSATERSHQ